MKKKLFVFIGVLLSLCLFGQDCPIITPPVNSQCGDPPIVSYEADGIATFCESQQVVFINTTFEPLGFYDYFIINWGDATPWDTIYNYNDVTHVFDFSNLNRCAEGPAITGEYCYVGILNCDEGLTSHGQSGFFQVKLRPVADFSYEQVVCIGDEVSFTEESCNEATYAWDFNGDGIIDSTDPTATHIFSNSGPHNIFLEVTNDCGSDMITQTIQVVESPTAEIDLGVSGGELCAANFQTITMNADQWVTGPSGYFSWEISPGYTNMNGDWCFVDPDYNGSGQICLHDSTFTDNTVDSLLSVQEQLHLYFRGPGEYTVTLDYGNICESKSVTETIYVYAPPSINGFNNQSGCDEVEICFNGLGISVGGDYDAVEWFFDNGSSSGSMNLDFGCVTFQLSGTMTLNVSASGLCMDISETINVNVIATQEVTIPDPVPNIICQNTGLVQLAPSSSGGTYLYNGSPVTFISNNMLDPSGLNPGDYTITYVLSDNPDCPAEDDFSFTIQPGPSITLGDNDTVCESISGFNPAISNYGGDIDAWAWTVFDSDGNTVMTSSEQNPSFSINTPDTYTIEVELISDECGSVMDTSALIIQTNVQAIIDPFNNPYCQGSSPDTLTATPPDGTWSGNGIINETEGIFDPSEVMPGNHPITYSIVNGACSSSATESIEVVASENVNVRDTFFCITDTPGQLYVSHTGGEFDGNGIINVDTGIFDPARADLGSNTIVYSYIDVNSCEVIRNINVDVDTIPAISLNDTVFVCIGNEDIDISALVNIDTHGENGTLTYTGTGIANSSLGTFNGSSLDTGFYTIIVGFDARSCSAQDSFVVELAEKPELILSEDEMVCVTDGSYTLTANIPYGEWSSYNCMIDPDTGEIDLESIGEADCVFQYTLSPGTSCEQSKVVNITIVDLSNDIQVPSDISICYTQEQYTIPNFAPADGTWSGEGIIDTSNGVINVSQLDQGTSYIYTYCIESEEIDCAACKDFGLAIEPLPVASFTLDGSPCQNQPFSVINNSTNAVSYEWNFGDSTIVSSFEPNHTYSTPGEKTITLIAETAFGCTDTISLQAHVTAPPTLDLIIFTEEGCAPLEIDYTNNSTGENTFQYWVIDGVNTLFEAQPQIILDSVTTDSLITLELVVYNDCETLSQSKEILVHPYPIVDFGINDDEGCSPDTVYFMNATLGLPDNFLWDFGNDNTSTELDPPPQIYYSPDDSISTYTISLFASNGCGDGLIEKEILVYPNNVDAFFEIDTLSGCPPLAVNIRNYATMGATVTYDFGDGGTGNSGDTTYIYTEPGKYVITQYASLCGTDSIQSDTIIVFPLANVDFDLPAYACAGDSVHFINLSTDGVVSEWHFGDGFTSDETNPNHIYDSSGTYEVSLIMNSIYNDCPDTLSKSIFIPELPQAIFAAIPSEACPDEMIVFENQSIGAQNYEWDFGDNSGSDQENPSHSYSEPDAYEVRLTVFDEYGCSMDTAFINLLIHPNPISSFVLLSDEICQFYDTLATTNTSSGYITSIWNLNGNFYTDQQNDIRLVLEDSGNQELELITINTFGCKDTSQTTFEVLPSPIARANFSDMNGCQELTLDFIDISENSNLTRWNFDGNNASTDSISPHTFVEHGNYTVQLVASNTNGCPSDTFFIEVDVFPRAIANFDIVPFDSCGVPLEIELINTSEFSSDYDWGFGNGDTSSFFEPVAEYNDHGTYLISLISSNDYNCPDTAMKSLTVYPLTMADFSIPITELCEDDTVTVINNSIGANTYDWYLNNESFDDFPLVITESGEYYLTMVASYDGNCIDTSPSIENVIYVYDSPHAGFTAIIDESQNIIGDVRFVNTSVDAESYFWEFGDGNTSREEHPEHEYDIDGPVTVTLYSYNNNGGLLQCIDRVSELIHYERINTFYVPNAMSPDQNYGNAEVGVFQPKGVGIQEYELNIYSPWGDKIATLNQVFNGEPTDFWDGTFNGQPVPQGAYLWTAKIKYQSGHTDFKKGNVTLLR